MVFRWTSRSRWIACILSALYTSLSAFAIGYTQFNLTHIILFDKYWLLLPAANISCHSNTQRLQVCVPLTTRTVNRHATYPFHLLTVVSGILYLLATDHEQAGEEKNWTFQNCKLCRISATSRTDMITQGNPSWQSHYMYVRTLRF